MEDKLKNRIASEIDNRTLGKIIKNNQTSEDNFLDSLFEDDFYNEDFYNSLKEQLEKQEEVEAVPEPEMEQASADGSEELPFKEPDEKGQSIFGEMPKVKGEIIKAEELKPEVVEFVTNAVVERLHKEQGLQITEYIQGKVISIEEWYKLILWKYFPVIGIPIYLMFLLLLNMNVGGKYDITLQNYAKAEIKTFWIYALVHIIVVFTCCAAVISLVNIFNRGLAA